MVFENRDILFEGRDVNNRKILFLGIWLFVFILVVSALMIPLCFYLWEISAPPSGTSTAATHQPAVILEVMPNYEIQKWRTETSALKTDEKIAKAMAESLEKGFAVRERQET